MKKKTKLISIILGVVMITGITSVTVLRLNSISPIEQEYIDEYGDIAEMYYNAFDFPDKKHKNSKLLRQNGFEKFDQTTTEYSKLVIYTKNVIINDENCDFEIIFNYDREKTEDLNMNMVTFFLVYSYQDTEISISTHLYIDEYISTVSISESTASESHTVSIDLLNGELYFPPEDEDLYLYDNYLNGEYDMVIDEMLAIMDDPLK